MLTKILWIVIFAENDAKSDKDEKKLLMVTQSVKVKLESESSWPNLKVPVHYSVMWRVTEIDIISWIDGKGVGGMGGDQEEGWNGYLGELIFWD